MPSSADAKEPLTAEASIQGAESPATNPAEAQRLHGAQAALSSVEAACEPNLSQATKPDAEAAAESVAEAAVEPQSAARATAPVSPDVTTGLPGPAAAPFINPVQPVSVPLNTIPAPASVSPPGTSSTDGVPAPDCVPAPGVVMKDSLETPSAPSTAKQPTTDSGSAANPSTVMPTVAGSTSPGNLGNGIPVLDPGTRPTAAVHESTAIFPPNPPVPVNEAPAGVARTLSMHASTPAAGRQGSETPASSLPMPSSPTVVANVPGPSPVPSVHVASLANSRDQTPQPVAGASTPMTVDNAGLSPSQQASGSLLNPPNGMLHAPTWEKLQEAAKESRMAWTHPSQSRQVETDVLHLCRAIVKLPELSLTQSFISQRSGVSQGTLSHYVRGLHQGNQRSVEDRLSNFLRRFCDGEFDQMIPVPGAERPKPMPTIPRAPLSRPSTAAATPQGIGHSSLALNVPAAGLPVNMTNAIYHQPYPVDSVAHHQQMMENMAAAAFARAAHPGTGLANVAPVPMQSSVLTVQQQQQQQLQLQAQQRQVQHHQQLHQQQVIDRVRRNAVPAAQASAQQGMVMTPASATQPRPPGGGVYAPQNNNQPFKRPRPMYGAPLPDDTAGVTARDAVEKAFHASKAVSWNDAHGNSEPLLLPVEVHVDIDGLVVYTFVQWDVNERIKSPESIAKEMREERDLPVEFEHAIAAAIRRSLFDAGVVPPPPPPVAEADAEDGGEENLRVIKIVLELNDDDGQTQILRDSFEWDIGAGGGDVWNSPETFSQTLCADAGIAQKHAATVSRAIRHELSRAHAIAYGDEETKRSALSQVGLASSIAKKLPVVRTALRQLSGDELRIQRREENEVMVHSMFVKPMLTEVEIERRRREVSRKLEIELAQQREKEHAEAEKSAKLAASREAALKDAEVDRLEADRKAKIEDGLDITPYTSLKLGYNSHPSIWVQGVAERKEAKEPMFPASGLAAAAIAEADYVEPTPVPNIRIKVNGVAHSVKRERQDGAVSTDSNPSKFVAVEAEDGTVLRLPLKEDGVVDVDGGVVAQPPNSDSAAAQSESTL